MPPAILLIEDDKLTRLILQTNLEEWGYQVVGASSGEEATKAIVQQPFAAILMDHSLPGIDGTALGVVFKNHEKHRRTPVLIMSANPDFLEPGNEVFDGYILKPVSLDALRNKLSELTSHG
ncbi:MAG: response regulator [Gemmataceae bacterium]|nr:response regulator [Gemmataceae bacterium]